MGGPGFSFPPAPPPQPAYAANSVPLTSAAGFTAGDKVTLHGLKNAQQLNGCIGTCVHYDPANGRWTVVLVNDLSEKALKPENLQAVAKKRKADDDASSAARQGVRRRRNRSRSELGGGVRRRRSRSRDRSRDRRRDGISHIRA